MSAIHPRLPGQPLPDPNPAAWQKDINAIRMATNRLYERPIDDDHLEFVKEQVWEQVARLSELSTVLIARIEMRD